MYISGTRILVHWRINSDASRSVNACFDIRGKIPPFIARRCRTAKASVSTPHGGNDGLQNDPEIKSTYGGKIMAYDQKLEKRIELHTGEWKGLCNNLQ